MDQHQQDRQHARNAVQVELHAPGVIEHQASAEGVKDQPQPKESRVPGLEPPLQALAPDADRVQDEGQVDGDDGGQIHGKFSP